VWLSPDEERGYYDGFANSALWPLCHIAYERPTFEEDHWRHYAAVNERFADAIAEEAAGSRALVFIQDYHFALLPRLVKQRLPSAVVCQFWHIPWPNPEAFRICPWKQQILEGLLGNDLLAFHIQYHCNNFLDTIDREIESRIDRERFSVTRLGSETLIRPHPISVDFDQISRDASGPATLDRVERLRAQHRLHGLRVLLGVDRLDYTKGLPERLRAFDRMLQRHPSLAGRVALVQLAVPSRARIAAYRALREAVARAVEEVNRRHATPSWTPVVHLEGYEDRSALAAWYRLADACVVTSLHDGMNLVAKEYVAARADGRGVLVLSRFTGAARELEQALLVNPFAVSEMGDAFAEALALRPEDQRARMERMRETVRAHNVYRWVGRLLEQAARLEPS
jgi:trehalose 6-phosphate synthase